MTDNLELGTLKSKGPAPPSTTIDPGEQSTMFSALQSLPDNINGEPQPIFAHVDTRLAIIEGSATPSAKRRCPFETGANSDSSIDTSPAKRFKGPENPEEVSGEETDVVEPPTVPATSSTPVAVPVTQPTRIHNRLGRHKPEDKWKEHFNIDLSNDGQVQWYKVGNGENARQVCRVNLATGNDRTHSHIWTLLNPGKSSSTIHDCWWGDKRGRTRMATHSL